MKFTNETDQPVRFRRTHRFGDEQPTIVTVAPGQSLPVSQVHDFEPLAGLPPPVDEAAELAAIEAALAEAESRIVPVTTETEIVPAPV